MTIVMCVVFAAVAVIISCGQERLGSHFELVKRAGTEENIEREEGEMGMRGDGDLKTDFDHLERV